jgi:hypothetical protein
MYLSATTSQHLASQQPVMQQERAQEVVGGTSLVFWATCSLEINNKGPRTMTTFEAVLNSVDTRAFMKSTTFGCAQNKNSMRLHNLAQEAAIIRHTFLTLRPLFADIGMTVTPLSCGTQADVSLHDRNGNPFLFLN